MSEYVEPDLVVTDVRPGDIGEILSQLVAPLSAHPSGPAMGAVLEALVAREALLSTGIGQGVAVPHAISENVDATKLVVGVARHGVEFHAIDGAPVHVFFVLISPPERQAKATHIKLLARIARLARHSQLVSMLRECEEPQQIVDGIARYEREHI